MEETKRARADERRLGTFSGVFTPSILTILGIILFLRLGFVTGEAGLGRALVIILLANTISVLTSFSLSAIATNFEVKGGGDYYLISRTLGAQFGGAIGIVLFLAQSISIAFYAIGFGEAVAAMLPADWIEPRLLSGVAVVGLFVLAWLGSDWATRFQYVIMAFLFVALAAFVAGAAPLWSQDTLAGNWAASGEMPFWGLFALFFPAVTGFTQGVSMSGELKDPARSLPLGTFLAVGVSMVVYFGVAVLFAAAAPGSELTSDNAAMRRLSFSPWMIDAGVIAATLSSALASFLGAPRILQSLASDRLVPLLSFFSRTEGAGANPRRGVVLSGLIAASVVAVGDLNLIAPVVSMFFLVSYGLLNYATYFEARTKSPSFRPRFRFFHERLSLAGCVACVGAIVAIQPTAGAIALALLMGLHQLLGYSGSRARWADSSRSNAFQRIRRHLLAMSDVEEHSRDWRPVILAFSNDSARLERLIRFASWIEGESGLTTAVRLVTGTGPTARKARQEAELELVREVQERELEAFARAVVVADVASGFPVVLQAAGLGPIRPNCVLLNWFDQTRFASETPGLASFGSYARSAIREGCSVILLEASLSETRVLEGTPARKRRIDVWWRGDASSRLALMLAYLMTRTDEWGAARIRLIGVAPPGEESEALRAELDELLDDVRIDAALEVLPDSDPMALASASADASLVFLTFRIRDDELLDASGEPFGHALDELPVVALVLAAQDIDLESQPDEGPQAEAAEAAERAEAAEKRAKSLAETAEEALRARERALAELDEAVKEELPVVEIERLRQELATAETEAEGARRRALKAQAKASTAKEEVESLGPGSGSPA